MRIRHHRSYPKQMNPIRTSAAALAASIAALSLALPVSADLFQGLKNTFAEQENRKAALQKACLEKWNKAQYVENLGRGYQSHSRPNHLTGGKFPKYVKDARFYIDKNNTIWAIRNSLFGCTSDDFAVLNKPVVLKRSGKYRVSAKLDPPGKLVIYTQVLADEWRNLRTGKVKKEIIRIKKR
ncbi:hypothetical protein MITS9504_00550 [Synechococcus sp. MIT S9504]|nr:hypothetical protein MITS9504_00550 [Synechococcus sp. MIT S9504]